MTGIEKIRLFHLNFPNILPANPIRHNRYTQKRMNAIQTRHKTKELSTRKRFIYLLKLNFASVC